jgi:ABC-type nitrate/sulfonate/bicarbonate transport system ATPase subunit
MTEPIITIKKLKKTYPRAYGRRRTEVFSDVDLTIHHGEFLILLGPSGCGKSTFLRILAGLDEASAGTVEYHSAEDRKDISFVFQNFGLLPWLTVGQNVSLGLLNKKLKDHELAREVDAILEKFGLLQFRHAFPHELSGGMKQRVGLARAFVTKPKIVFLDEPFSELDFFTAKNLRELLLQMWKENGTTVVMVSHYIDEAVYLSDRIAVFSDRPGTLRKVIPNTLPRSRHYRSPEFFALEDEVLKHFEGNRG